MESVSEHESIAPSAKHKHRPTHRRPLFDLSRPAGLRAPGDRSPDAIGTGCFLCFHQSSTPAHLLLLLCRARSSVGAFVAVRFALRFALEPAPLGCVTHDHSIRDADEDPRVLRALRLQRHNISYQVKSTNTFAQGCELTSKPQPSLPNQSIDRSIDRLRTRCGGAEDKEMQACCASFTGSSFSLFSEYCCYFFLRPSTLVGAGGHVGAWGTMRRWTGPPFESVSSLSTSVLVHEYDRATAAPC